MTQKRQAGHAMRLYRPLAALVLLTVQLAALPAHADCLLGCLVQKPKPAGCHSRTGASGCTTASQVDDPYTGTISPDGKSAYITLRNVATLLIFDRNPVTGELTQKAGTAGCISQSGDNVTCAYGFPLQGPTSPVVSPDGEHVYVGASPLNAIAVFDRNTTTGALTQKASPDGCLSDDGSAGICSDGRGLRGVIDLVISPDGEDLYAAGAASNAIAHASIAGDGRLSQGGNTFCISQEGGVECVDGRGLSVPLSLVIDPDGERIYVAGTGGITLLLRDPATGALSQPATSSTCTSDNGTGGECRDGYALASPVGIAISPDGQHLYSVHQGITGSIALFDVEPAGYPLQKAGAAGCISNTGNSGTCGVSRGMASPTAITISSDGANAYVSASNSSAVAIFDRDAPTGLLTQKAAADGCINSAGTGGCASFSPAVAGFELLLDPTSADLYLLTGAGDAVVGFDRTGVPRPTTTTTTSTTSTTLPDAGCLAAPRTDCNDMLGKARITLRAGRSPAGSGIDFVWKRGAGTTVESLGDPVDGMTQYDLCIYEGGAPANLVLPAGGTCDGRPCWRRAGSGGFSFFDKSAANDGTREVSLRGGTDGDARIYWKAKGSSTPVPALPLDAPLTVQVVASGDDLGARCWEAVFPTASIDKDTKFEARLP